MANRRRPDPSGSLGSGGETADREPVFLANRLSEAFRPDRKRSGSDVGGGPIDLDELVPATSFDRRVRAVQRGVERGDSVVGLVMRAAAEPMAFPVRSAEGRFVGGGVLEAMVASGHLEVVDDDAGGQLQFGPRAFPTPGFRDLTLDEPSASLVIGVQLVLSDRLDLLRLLPPLVTTFGMAYSLLGAVVTRSGGVELASLRRVLLRQLARRGMRSDDITHGVDRLVWWSVLQLLDLGWVSYEGRVASPLTGLVTETELGLFGYLMAVTEFSGGGLPTPLQELMIEAGYLPCDGGLISPDDLPQPLSFN